VTFRSVIIAESLANCVRSATLELLDFESVDAGHHELAILDLPSERIELVIGALALRQALYRVDAAVQVHDEIVRLEYHAGERILLGAELCGELRGVLRGECDRGTVGPLVFGIRGTRHEEQGRCGGD